MNGFSPFMLAGAGVNVAIVGGLVWRLGSHHHAVTLWAIGSLLGLLALAPWLARRGGGR